MFDPGAKMFAIFGCFPGCIWNGGTILAGGNATYETIKDTIDYYNNVEHNSNTANSAMTLQKEALCMVVGNMAKEKCQTNIDILENDGTSVFIDDAGDF